ncbi:MAG: Linear gramicidin synthase subunit D [Candidatus Celerinatantimonas neptuna]|nr:MAG: Linear gramicidin synthase subunit D [Candidatus Celerinatantimonas neptuna]
MTISVEFEKIVAQFPGQTAVVQGDSFWTYRQLNDRVLFLCQGLIEQAGDDDYVLTFLGQDLNLVVSVVSIGRAGKVFVPLAPQLPAHRLAMLMARFPQASVITSRQYLSQIKPLIVSQKVILVDDEGKPEIQPKAQTGKPIGHELNYIYFTSGSTGTPKAVQGRDDSLLHFIRWESRALLVTSEDRVTQLTAQMFDPFLRDLWLPLLNGATLHLLPSSTFIYDIRKLLCWVKQQQVTVMHAIPSLFQVMLEQQNSQALQSLRCIALAGEMLKVGLVEQFFDARLSNSYLFNFYGPTEATLAKFCYPVTHNDVKRKVIPVGLPIEQSHVVLVDEVLNPVSQGEIGEVLICSPWLSAGYLESDSDAFIQWGDDSLAAYRSGDLGYLDQDGLLVLCGRNDTQIKIDGQRVEVGELEGLLERHPQVHQAILLVSESEHSSPRLQAFVERHANQSLSGDQLRRWLADYVSTAWLPAQIQVVDLFPRLANGKVDRGALRQAYPIYTKRVVNILPKGQKEEQLALIWQQLLNVDMIDRHDNFFRLHGTSLLGIRMIALVRSQMGLNLDFGDLLGHPTLVECAECLYETLEASFDVQAEVTVSLEQQGLWLIQTSQPQSPVYHMAYRSHWQGPLNHSYFEQAVAAVQLRYDALRTAFVESDGEPLAKIASDAAVTITHQSSDSFSNPQALDDWLVDFAHQPFDLNVAPLLRIACLKLAEQNFLFVVVMNHLIADEMSVALFWQSVLEQYRQLVMQAELVVQVHPCGQIFQAQLQRQLLNSEQGRRAKAYWQEKLAGELPLLQLPYDFPPQLTHHYYGHRVGFLLGEHDSRALLKMAQDLGATPYIFLMAVWNAFLSRYCRQQDILLGTPVSRRHQLADESAFGALLSVFVMRSEIDLHQPLSHVVHQLRHNFIEAMDHSAVALTQLPELLHHVPVNGVSPLFQSMFVWREQTADSERIAQATIEPLQQYDIGVARYELTLEMWQDAQCLNGSFEYALARFKPETIERLSAGFQVFIADILRLPQAPLNQLSILPQADYQQLVEWNSGQVPYHQECGLNALIEQVAQRLPDEIALESTHQRISYQQMNERANQLARLLNQYGVDEGIAVGVSLERSPELMIAMLAVFKAGGIYVPIDPDYPMARNQYVMKDASVQLLLTQQHYVERYQNSHCPVLDIESQARHFALLATDNLTRAVSGNSIAYVIYTSGSTGEPKGVPIRHHSVCNMAEQNVRLMRTGPGHRIVLFASTSFDTSLIEITMALCAGATLVLASKMELMPGPDLLKFLKEKRINYLTMPPSALAVMPYENLPDLEVISVAGEPSGHELLNKWGEGRRYVNLYGPTETAVYMTHTQLEPGCERIHLGRPMANVNVWILDEYHQPLPIGVVGEICIGGVGLSPGYLNKSEQTQQRFIAHPFAQSSSERIYCSGDLGRYLPDGSIECIGRIDHQVKIRGYRVEMGEIETAVSKHPSVQDAVVMVREDYLSATAIIAYVVTETDKVVSSDELADYLGQRLPEYMCPSCYITLEEFPRLPNDKIDRKRLPCPQLSLNTEIEAPVNETEAAIITVWQSLLGIGAIGRTTSFFQIGGHSLLAAKAVARLAEQYRLHLRVSDIFRWRTPAQLASHVLQDDTQVSLSDFPADMHSPLSRAQQRMLFLSQHDQDDSYWIGQVKLFNRLVDLQLLHDSLVQLWELHPILNLRLTQTGDGKVVQYFNNAPVICATEQWSLDNFAQWQQHLHDYTRELMSPVDSLLDMPLYRVVIVENKEKNQIALIMVLHHILVDEQSMQQLDEQLLALCMGQAVECEPVNYLQYSRWEQQAIDQSYWLSQLAFWQEQFKELPPALNLSPGVKPDRGDHRGAVFNLNIERVHTEQLRQRARQGDTSLFSILFATFQLLMQRHSGERDIVIGVPVSLREDHPNLQSMTGLLLNTLAVRQRIGAQQTVDEFLSDSAQNWTRAFENKSIPFELVVDSVLPGKREASLFQVMFVYNAEPARLSDDALSLTNLPVENHSAKFDLTFFVKDHGDELTLQIEYRQCCFSEKRIEQLGEHYQRLLKGIIQYAEQPVIALPLLSQAERQMQLKTLQGEHLDLEFVPVHQCFEKQVGLTAGAVAVQCGSTRWTFNELNQYANQVAHQLLSSGIGIENRVAILLPRGLWLVAAIVGAMKSRAAWIPIDPNYPTQRISTMLETAKVDAVLSFAENQIDADVRVIAVDQLSEQLPKTNPDLPIHPEQLCYILFTSGSTGTPKGVMIPHRALHHYISHVCHHYVSASGNGATLHGSIAFDATLTSLFMPLVVGQSIHIVSQDDDLGALVDVLENTPDLSLVKLTPAHLELLSQHLSKDAAQRISRLIVGGESLLANTLQFWREEAPEVEIINEYGPTEATVGCTTFTLSAGDVPDEGQISIGRPIANTQIYLLDEFLQMVPMGTAGEIYIGGPGVAQGYDQRDDLSAERFIANPFVAECASRLYRTGDRACYQDDGNLCYLGRDDHQVKLNGYRIELEEVEAQLRSCDGILQAAVAVMDVAGRSHLMAWVAGESRYEQSVREQLAQRLPRFMRPTQWQWFDSLPLTTNAKIDRKFLLALPVQVIEQPHVDRPLTNTEQSLQAIWQQVLGRDVIGPDEDFFALGGDSIMSLQIVFRAREAGLSMTVAMLFDAPTIAELATRLVPSEPVKTSSDHLVTGHYDLLPAQRWFFNHYQHLPNHYNQSILWQLSSGVNHALLEQSLRWLMDHHDGLRASYDGHQGFIRAHSSHFKLDVIELDCVDEIDAHIADYQSCLNIEMGPLFVPVLFDTPHGKWLFIAAHHLLVDGVSWRIIEDDLTVCYQRLCQGMPWPERLKSASLIEWTDHLKQVDVAAQQSFWEPRMSAQVKRLPCDCGEYPALGLEGQVQRCQIVCDKALTQSFLQDSYPAYRTNPGELLLTALGLTLCEWSGHKKLRIDTEGHGRDALCNDLDVSRTVGWFTSFYPLVLELDTQHLRQAMIAVKESIRQVPHGGTGYGAMLASQQLNHICADVCFNYLGQFSHSQVSGLFANAGSLNLVNQHADTMEQAWPLEVEGFVRDGQLHLSWIYSDSYKSSTIEQLMARMTFWLETLIGHCQECQSTYWTPSDFPLTRLASEPLFQLQTRFTDIEDIYPLTPLQEGMLYHSMSGDNYHEQLCYALPDGCDFARLKAAWLEAMIHYPILRTTFDLQHFNEPVQIVHHRRPLSWEVIELSSKSEREAFLASDRECGFDMEQSSLFRLAILRIPEQLDELVVSHHHAILDGWSVRLLTEQIARFVCEPEMFWPKTPAYRQYIRYFRQFEKSAGEYWQSQYELMHQTSLPFSWLNRQENDQKHVFSYALTKEQTEPLVHYARANRLTLNTLLQGAWALVLQRYSGQQQVMFGSTVSGRNITLVGVEQMIGLFINTLPTCVDCERSMSVTDWLRALQHQHRQNEDHAQIALTDLKLNTRLNTQERLFDSVLVFENYPQSSPELTCQLQLVDAYERTNYPLTLVASLRETLYGQFVYDSGLFCEQEIDQLVQQWLQLLKALTQAQTLSDLAMDHKEEQLLSSFQGEEQPVMMQSVYHQFLQQAKVRPHAVAVIDGDQAFSYQQLQQRVEQFAWQLNSQGIRQGDRVVVWLPRCCDYLATILAIHRLSACYVPVDSHWPDERVQWLLDDCQAGVLVTTSALFAKLSLSHECLLVDHFSDAEGVLPMEASIKPSDLAYIIYTSGSSGTPKGVMVEHRHLNHYLGDVGKRYQVDAKTQTLFYSSISFDATLTSVYLPLIHGGTVRIIRDDGDINGIRDALRQSDGPVVLKLTPVHLNLLNTQLDAGDKQRVTTLVLGGEALTCAAAQNWLDDAPLCRLFNEYGPTEATVGCCVYQAKKLISSTRATVAIGAPLSNTRLMVLDDYGQGLPRGALGELYIAGEGVARGYWHRESLTGERFIERSTQDGRLQRFYRTGDRVASDLSGVLHYLGRMDRQIKLRGFRIEPGEVEAELLRHRYVQQSAVQYDQVADRLVAWVASDTHDTLSESELHVFLSDRLPSHMVPGRIVILEQMPQTANGKVDYRQLSIPEIELPIVNAEPQTETESLLCTIWQDVLGVKNIHCEQNFFQLGGHSLHALRIVARIEQQLSKQISLHELLHTPTIRQLALHLDKQQTGTSGQSIHRVVRRRQTHSSSTAVDK